MKLFRRSYVISALSLVICVTAVVMSGSKVANAVTGSAAGQNITMTPSSTEVSVAPGSSKTDSFTVINQGKTDFNVTTYADPYHVKGVTYDPQFTPLAGTTDASKWVHMSAVKAQPLAAHKQLSVSYTVNVPKNTAPGGYYAVLFAETSPAGKSNGVVAHNRVGNILYITVEGAVKKSGSIKGLSVPFMSVSTEIPIGTEVSNTGGVHFITNASTSVFSVFGKKVFSANLKRYVLPQTTRKIEATWTNTAPIGLYRVERSATIAGKVQKLPNAWIFVIQPWVIAFFAVLILIIVGEIIYRHKRKKT